MRRNVVVSVLVAIGLALGGAGVADAKTVSLGSGPVKHATVKKAKPKKAKTYTERQMFECAGAVQLAEDIVNGGDRSKNMRKQFNRAADRCAKVTGGF